MPHSRELNRPATARRRRTLAPWIAGGVSLVMVLVVLVVAWNAANSPQNATPLDDAAPESVRLGEGESGRSLNIELADADDPTRKAGEITAARWEPISSTQRRVEQPEAWFYLDDGRTLHIRADAGRFDTPPGQREPESGRIEGNVIIRLFAADSAAGRPVPGQTPAEIEATTDQPLDFDVLNGTLSTAGRLVVKGERIELVGSDVRAFINEPKERIDQLRIARGERIVVRPAPAEPTPVPVSLRPAGAPALTLVRAPTIATPSLAPAPVTPPAPAVPKIDLYQARFNQSVVLTQGSRSLDADELDVWARVIDNQLPTRDDQTAGATPTALGTSPSGDRLAAVVLAALAGLQPEEPARAPAKTDPVDPAAPAEPVVLTWTGEMLLSVLRDTEPQELAGSDLFARFTAPQSREVRFRDAGDGTGRRGAEGVASVVTYDDTNQSIGLLSPVDGVELRGVGAGELTGVAQLRIDLPLATVTVVGPGELRGAEDGTAKEDGSERRRAVTWRDGAAFTFEMEDGRMTDRIRRATFTDNVVGVNDASELRAAYLDASFVASDRDEGRRRLEQVDAEAAQANDGRGASLDADALSLHFASGTSGEDADPTRLIATGQVRGARKDGALIESDSLNARLARDAEGDVIVTDVLGGGVTRFEDGRGRSAAAHRLVADLLTETAVLDGAGDAAPARIASQSGAVTGQHLELNGPLGTLLATGAGGFERDAGDGIRLSATWTRAMAFDDRAGVITAEGDATADAVDGTGRSDTLRADALRVAITPKDQAESADQAASEGEPAAERQILSAVATARSEARADWARIERRQRAKAADGTERVAELYHLEGGRIELDNTVERVDVPAPGLLLIVDDRAREPAAPAAPTPSGDPLEAAAADRAQSLFEWTGSMRMDRPSSTVSFTREVTVVHRRLTDGQVTTVEAEEIVARFRELGTAGPDGRARGELTFVEARGAVYIKSASREVIADRVEYDAERGIAVATARPGQAVTLFDAAKGSTQEADRIEWDLVRDDIRVTRPRPVTVPR